MSGGRGKTALHEIRTMGQSVGKVPISFTGRKQHGQGSGLNIRKGDVQRVFCKYFLEEKGREEAGEKSSSFGQRCHGVSGKGSRL